MNEWQVAYGLGTANSKRGSHEIDQSIINVTVKALQAGFTHLDCAEGKLNTGRSISSSRCVFILLTFVMTKISIWKRGRTRCRHSRVWDRAGETLHHHQGHSQGRQVPGRELF